jgi:hypothetical protein
MSAAASSSSSAAAMPSTIVAAVGVDASYAVVLAPDDEMSLLEQAKAKVNWQQVHAEVWDGKYAHIKDILGVAWPYRSSIVALWADVLRLDLLLTYGEQDDDNMTGSDVQ